LEGEDFSDTFYEMKNKSGLIKELAEEAKGIWERLNSEDK